MENQVAGGALGVLITWVILNLPSLFHASVQATVS